MQTVLLFGGRSFLGGHVCRALLGQGFRVLLHSSSSAEFRNISDIASNAAIEKVVCGFDQTDELRRLMGRSEFAIYAAIPYSKQSIGRSGKIRRDLLEFDVFLNLLAKSNIKKSVFISVSGTIGRVPGGIADETRFADADAPKGWGHLIQKIASEKMIERHVRDGLQAVIVNPSMCVGAFDTKPSTGEFFKFFAKAPFLLMPNELLNIVDVEDVAAGALLALANGASGERYILSGINTTMGALIQRIKRLAGKSVPGIAIPRRAAIVAAYVFEVLNLVARGPAPVIPLLGLELIEQGSQHLTYRKAEQDLGFKPRDAWLAVDRAYAWYKDNGIL